MASTVPPTRGTAFTVTFPIFDTSGKLKTGAAFSATQVSKDNGSFSAATNAPAELATASGVYTLALTGTEMTADVVSVRMVVSTASTQDVCVIIYTSARRVDDLAFPATSGRSMVVDAAGLVDANAVKLGPTGAGTAQTAGDVGIKTGFALTAGERTSIADAMLDETAGVETGLTVRQAFRLVLAALAGKVSGAGTATEVFRNAVADSKPRLTATVDSSGNRSAITTDVT